MPNNPPARVRDRTDDIDPRIARSTHALGQALIALLQERDYGEITVQQILDRAGVGRATFYAHYRNKGDVLHSSYERLFASLEQTLARPGSPGSRLFPVTEFLDHIGDQHALVDALRRAGELDDMLAQCAGYATRIIERRLAGWAGVTTRIPGPLAARMLAGALMETIGWWQDHRAVATSAALDAAFHELARGILRPSRPETRTAAVTPDRAEPPRVT